jgi:hypothetical protein
MSRDKTGSEPKALALVEQAVHLLRRNSGLALAEYYLGSLPFILALLYFWSDMSRDPMAARFCGPSSAGVALAFIWMKLWQARFCRHLRCRIQDEVPELWPLKRMLSTSIRQSFLHAFGVVALPVAALIAFPFGWVYAFFQNLSVLDDPQTKEVMTLARAAKEQAVLWPGQNHLVLTIMSFFGLFVFFNLALGILAMPYLLKWLLGIETVFTLSGMRLLNTTFLAVLCGLTYLCTDPIIKTVYVLRCFYGRSRLTGDDLRSALRPFLQAGVSVLLVSVCLVCSPARVSAQTTGENSSRPAVTDNQDFAVRLDDTIASVLQERRFAWRLPRKPTLEPEAEPGWIAATIQWIADGVRALARPVGRWIMAFLDWLKQKMPDPRFSRLDDGRDYRGLIRWIFYALGFGLALLLVYWLVRWLIRSRTTVQTETGPGESGRIDLADESITAEDLPLDQWVAMARDMLTRNDFRRALRALYLSVLAVLADRQRVTIARYKSNLDYARELGRRAHAEPELLGAFQWCVRIFESTWYGMHPVSRLQVEDFMKQQQRIADLVQRTA